MNKSTIVNKRGSVAIAKFIIISFIFLVFLGLSPMLNGAINASQENLSCGAEYSLICFILDSSLPIIALILLTMLIGFLKGER